jgi:CHAT domain-containing protein
MAVTPRISGQPDETDGRAAGTPAAGPDNAVTDLLDAVEVKHSTYRAQAEPVRYPTETSLEAGILGKGPRPWHRGRQRPGFRVEVVHGDLQYARHPIVVGHYEGDTIVGAEAGIDARLGGALSQRYSLGLYPGKFGSVAVILRKPTPLQEVMRLPSGAIVIGLGKWGELSGEQLGELLRRAALQYVLQLCDDRAASPDAGEDTPAVGLSVLLVGGNSAPNIAIGDSVGAILRAIAQANRELAGGRCDAMTIRELEIIELYADRATEAAHAVNRLAPLIDKELDTTIEAVPLLQRGRGWRRRLRSTSNGDAWRRWEVSVVTPPRESTPARLPKPLADRLKRAVLESKDADAELLEALAELAIDQPAETAPVHREIRFLTLSDRARAEQTSQQRQPELVERLIKDSISQTRYRPEESRVLFELTVPNALKSGLAQIDRLVLVVDAESAAYPWELMSAGDKPLCLAKHLVRQLQTASYRPQIGARAGTAAYVVGDPKVSPPFNQLPGAEKEASAVYDLLRTEFEVEQTPSKPSALEVLAGLYKKPYRIVHLAGHGYYEPPTTAIEKARSGMVLDNGVFLTAVEIQQMQQVPELVFLNCCHIGQTGPEPVRTNGVEFNRLAASVSRELIAMGVRAVVAAGWAVEDAAAKLFAETFYRRMLGGDAFGDALKAAREDTHDKFSESNTWGAYQAYGDPDYRLDPAGTGGTATEDERVDVAEFIEAVDDIDPAADRGLSRPADPAVRLDGLVKKCPSEWLEQTDVQMAIGVAYGRLGQFEQARRYLLTALDAEGNDSTTTLRAVEQLANFEARLADQNTDGQAGRARELHESAITRLERLLTVAETAERHSLLGSAYWRRAAAEPDATKARTALAQAGENYRRAHLLSLQRKGLDPYPALNWLTVATLLGEQVPDADALIDRCEAYARERFLIDRTFFTAIGRADAGLVRALVTGGLGGDNTAAAKEFGDLQALFEDVVKQAAPTASELDSVDTHIRITSVMLDKLGPKRRATRTSIARLAELRRTLAGDVQG